MSSVIGGMEETIAQTMAQIGWPGADQLQPESDDALDEAKTVSNEAGSAEAEVEQDLAGEAGAEEADAGDESGDDAGDGGDATQDKRDSAQPGSDAA